MITTSMTIVTSIIIGMIMIKSTSIGISLSMSIATGTRTSIGKHVPPGINSSISIMISSSMGYLYDKFCQYCY